MAVACPVCRRTYLQSDLRAHLWTSHSHLSELIDAIVRLTEELEETRADRESARLRLEELGADE